MLFTCVYSFKMGVGMIINYFCYNILHIGLHSQPNLGFCIHKNTQWLYVRVEFQKKKELHRCINSVENVWIV